MAESNRPIATPWQVRLRHLGIHWFHGPLFLATVLLLAWLWSAQVAEVLIVGQVEAIEVDVPSHDGGILMPLDEPLTRFDRVDKDLTLIARIDVSEALSEMQTLTAERDRLQALIASETERLRLEQRRWAREDLQHELRSIGHGLDRERNRTSSRDQVDELRREVSDLRQRKRELELKLAMSSAQRAADEQTLKGLQRQRLQVEDLVRRKVTTAIRLDELVAQIDVKQLEIDKSRELDRTMSDQINSIREELLDAESRLARATVAWDATRALTETATRENPADEATQVDIDTLLEPLARALAVQDAKVRTLAQRIASNEVRAPVSGMVSRVHHPPGTYVRSGETVVTIAADRSRWIIAYLDQRYRGVLRPQDKIEIRVRGGAGQARVAQGTVEEVGAQYVLIPEHLGRSPEATAWGLPVRIAIPDELALIPGEMVDLVFAVASGRRF